MLLSCILLFTGPIILGAVVVFLESNPSVSDIYRGLLIVLLLTASSVLSSVIDTNNSIRSWSVKVALQGALTRLVFALVLMLLDSAFVDKGLSSAQINNLVQMWII